MTKKSTEFELIIKPKYGLLDLNIRELIEYKETLFFLSLRDVAVKYKQTIMGASWAVMQPLFTMIIFTLIFGGLAQMPSEGIPYPLFSYSGLVLWTYFSTSLSASSLSLVNNRNLLSKIYIPRIFIPTAPALSSLVDYSIALCIITLFMFYYHFVPSITIVLLPFIVVITFMLTSGLGYWLSALCVKYRDVKFITSFFIQMLLFLSPVIYPTEIIGEKYQWLLYLNPMTGLINSHRACLLGYTSIDFVGLAISTVITVLIFVSGIFYLRKTEKYFADLI
jgi:lipopolysaccharide transport system permease protein